MAQSQIRVEMGAWVESSTPKASGKGMRKVWVSPTPKGESARLSVIARNERGADVHVLTLHANTPEERSAAGIALDMATKALQEFGRQAAKAPVPAKAPTPPPAVVRNPTPAKGRDAIVAKAREERAALSVGAPAKAPVVPSGDNWFRDLMAQAGAI